MPSIKDHRRPNTRTTQRDKVVPKMVLATDPGGVSKSQLVFYGFFFTVISLYSAFIVSPNEFKRYSEIYPAVGRPVVTAFEIIEAFSPFHEFIEEEANQNRSGQKENSPNSAESSKIFSKDELSKFDGSENAPGLYLSILGEVFDVSSGHDKYGPGGGYHFFTGKDGTRAFVTGEFNEAGLIDDVEGISLSDVKGLAEWIEFYRKDYKLVGKLAGNFYDENGSETAAMTAFRKRVAEVQAEDAKVKGEKEMFPPCNMDWSRERGHKVWCTNKSGGTVRHWVGVPRKLFLPGRKERCACIKDVGPSSTDPSNRSITDGDLSNPHVKPYEQCLDTPRATSCMLIQPEEMEKED